MISFNHPLNFSSYIWSIIIWPPNNSREEHRLWSYRKKFMTNLIRLPNHVTHVPLPRIAPSRAKVSGIRSEVFGELTFIDHGEVPINPQSKLQFLLMYDGATSLTTAFVVQNRSDTVTISHLQEYFETYQLNPKYIVADQAFMGTEMESYYNRHSIRPISLGPGTPWPNRAEAAIRMFKKQVSLMLISLKDDTLLANITYKQLLRQACISRNTMVTLGWCHSYWISIWKKTCRSYGDWTHESSTAHDWGPCSWETDWSTKVTGDAKVSRGKTVWWPSKRHRK